MGYFRGVHGLPIISLQRPGADLVNVGASPNSRDSNKYGSNITRTNFKIDQYYG